MPASKRIRIAHPDDGKAIYSFRYRDQIGKLWRISFVVQFGRVNDLLMRLFHYRGNRVNIMGGFIVASLTPINERKEREDAAAAYAIDYSLDGADQGRAEGAAAEDGRWSGGALVRYSVDDE